MIQSNLQSLTGSSNQSRFKIVIFRKSSRAQKIQTRRYHLQGTGVKFGGGGGGGGGSITLDSYSPKTMVTISRSQGCILSLMGAATSVIFVTTNTSFVVTKISLSQQNFCHDKHIFVGTKLLLQQIFVMTNIILSQQPYFCLLLQQKCSCHDKTILSWQT